MLLRMLPKPIPPSHQNAVHRIVLYHQVVVALPKNKVLWNEHEFFHQPGDVVS